MIAVANKQFRAACGSRIVAALFRVAREIREGSDIGTLHDDPRCRPSSTAFRSPRASGAISASAVAREARRPGRPALFLVATAHSGADSVLGVRVSRAT